jgi:homoserine kinase type II
MTNADMAGTLERVGIVLARFRPDLPIAGSPERCLERLAAESVDGRVWIVERHASRMAARKQEIARAAARIAARLPEVKPWLAFAPDRFVDERPDGAWQVSPFTPGEPLDRPAYAFEEWRGEVLADLLVRFRSAAADMPGRESAVPFSLAGFVRDLFGKLRDRDRALFERLYPALLHCERALFPALDQVPAAFCHGDFHPLNIIWSRTGTNALIDLEFCGFRPETYDAAMLVGCLGMEDPRCLRGGLVRSLVGRLRSGAGYSEAGWACFMDLVLGLRFAWLSDWLRRGDGEMVDLEAVYIGLLLEDREALSRAWT